MESFLVFLSTQVNYEEFLAHDPSYRQKTILEKLAGEGDELTINLEQYINHSAVSVPGSFSLHRF